LCGLISGGTLGSAHEQSEGPNVRKAAIPDPIIQKIQKLIFAFDSKSHEKTIIKITADRENRGIIG
jgi:hypothetical protein